MHISPEEVQEALAAIELTKAKTRKGYGYAGYYLMIWGAVWFIGFLVSQYLQSASAVVGWTWGGLVLIASICCTVMGVRQGKSIRSQLGPRIGYFYMTLFVFTVLWYILMAPESAKQGALFFVTIIMFAGTVIGIFSRAVQQLSVVYRPLSLPLSDITCCPATSSCGRPSSAGWLWLPLASLCACVGGSDGRTE